MKHLKKFGCGILIGISNLIPGFSGGTMALILGVLEELTDAIKEEFNPIDIQYFMVGTCIGAHSGPGVTGLLAFKK